MKILLIEDDYNKYSAIRDYIDCQWPDVNLTIKTSYHSGSVELRNNSYDLLFLDMSLPVFDETNQGSNGRFLAQGGLYIMLRMKHTRIKTRTIVITQYEEFGGITADGLDIELKRQFRDFYLGIVHYSAINADWKNNLNTILQKLR